MPRRLVILLPLVQLACAPPPRPDAPRRARELLAVWRSGGAAPLDTLLADSAVCDDLPHGTRYHGTAEIAQYVAHVHSWAGDVRFELRAVHGDESFAVVDRRFTPGGLRPIGAPDGRRRRADARRPCGRAG